jgi:hypothetical protein
MPTFDESVVANAGLQATGPTVGVQGTGLQVGVEGVVNSESGAAPQVVGVKGDGGAGFHPGGSP